MRAQKGKRSESFWPSIVMKKWLNVKPKLHDFSEDEFDTESEDNDASERTKESFFEIHEDTYRTNETSGNKTNPPLRRPRRRKSESLRINYISKKDVRVMIGTWNVAGRTPREDLDLEQWLCTRDPADMYVLGFQEVVPLNAGNVLGAEDTRPIPKWECIIRQTLNKSRQHKTICKSYSAPLSPLLGLGPASCSYADEGIKCRCGNVVKSNLTTGLPDKLTSLSEVNCNWLDATSPLDWPELPLDLPSDALASGTKLRRVVSMGLSNTKVLENFRGFQPQDVALQAGMKRAYHSSGNLGMLWSEQQETFDVLNSLEYISDWTSEENSPSVSVGKKHATPGNKESSKPRVNYVRIVSKQMVGIYISVWVCRKLRQHVNNLEVSPVGVGLMGYMGNKGSVSVSMSLFQTRLCFVCSHLTSGHKSGDQQKRNSDVYEILQRTRFSSLFATGQPQMISSHDRIFWFGDLNYRIDVPDAELRDLVATQRWHDLLKFDQLRKELINGHTFDGWKEGLINFPPTYKYEINSNRYVGEIRKDGEKKRSPAWCDRILWQGKGTNQLSYWSSDLSLSDHRPVSSIFSVEVEVFNQRKLERVLNFTNVGFTSTENLHKG